MLYVVDVCQLLFAVVFCSWCAVGVCGVLVWRLAFALFVVCCVLFAVCCASLLFVGGGYMVVVCCCCCGDRWW